MIWYKAFFLGILLTHGAFTEASQDKKDLAVALQHVQKKVARLEKTIYQNNQHERTLVAELSTLEKTIGNIAEKERKLKTAQLAHQQALKTLEQKKSSLQLAHDKQLKALAALIRADFQQSHKPPFPLLFETHEWSTLARLNEYYRYFYQARAEKIGEIKTDLLQLQILQEPIKREQHAVRMLAEKLTAQRSLLDKKIKQRQQVLDSLHHQQSHARDNLAQLHQQETHISKLLETLQNTLNIIPTYIDPMQNFSAMKKKLAFPVPVPGATLSKKTHIEALAGTPVNAIFPGKVIFAEWLRGVGLLIILDHGNGYMSLYGNNQKLYKTLGESVNQGEMIARVGESGGHSKAGLYFEIRKDGEALDPTPWFEQA